MRTFLLAVAVVESLALLVAAGLVLLGIEEQQAERPHIPVFRPAIYEAVIGDSVRYRRLDAQGRMTGYLDYKVGMAVEYKGTTFGREYILDIVERDARGKELRRRKMRVRPRDITHGFLPPVYEEDAYAQVPGLRPVVARIRPAPVTLPKMEVRGFLVEAVIPSRSLTEVAERYWMTRRVPIFGVARWERPKETLVLHTMQRAAP